MGKRYEEEIEDRPGVLMEEIADTALEALRIRAKAGNIIAIQTLFRYEEEIRIREYKRSLLEGRA